MEDLKRNLIVLNDLSREFGLEINERKSKVLIYEKRRRRGGEIKEGGVREVGGIEVVREIKYIGLEICDERDIFKKQKEKMIQKASHMALQIYSIIEKSSNKVMMGKTFWKALVRSSVFLGAGLIGFNKE